VFNLSEPESLGSIVNQGHDQYYSIRLSDVAQGKLNWHIGARDDAPALPPRRGAYQLLTTMQSAGVASMYYDPSQMQSTSVANIAAGNAPITIGNALSEAQSMGGTVVEIRAYDYVLSGAQREAVEKDLRAKYMLGRTSCSEILTHHPGAPEARYTIDPDGLADGDPVTVTCDMTDGGWLLISKETFTDDAEGWSPATLSSCGSEVNGGYGRILGGVGALIGGVTAQKTYNFDGWAHSQVRLSLDYIKMGDWNNEDGIVTVDGAPFFLQTFRGTDGQDSKCGSSDRELSVHVDMPFAHDSDNLTIEASCTLNNDESSEAFALDNVIVRIK
jgi:hypothetical protein